MLATCAVSQARCTSKQCDDVPGACHGLELGFVFDTLGCGTKPVEGANPPHELRLSVRGYRFAKVRAHATGHDEVRFDLAGRVRPRDLETSASGRGALICAVTHRPSPEGAIEAFWK